MVEKGYIAMIDIAISFLFVFLFLLLLLLSCQNHVQLLYNTMADLGAAERYPEHNLVSFRLIRSIVVSKIRQCYRDHWQRLLGGIQADVE
jgi:hypothetical protein